MAGLRAVTGIAGAALVVAIAAAGAQQGVTVPPPPPTEVREVVDTLHGVDVPDPYRWLEDQEAPETRAWIDAQNTYTDTVLGALPGRDRLRDVAAAVLERDAVGLPNERGGRYFYSRRGADQDLAVLYVRDGLDGAERVLIDPHPMSPDHTTSVEFRDISDDGGRVAYAVREGGVDEVSIRVRRVDGGDDLADVLPAARYGAVTLAPDGGGLYYERYGDVRPRVMYHAFGTPMADDVQLFGEGYERHQIPVTVVSDDGRWMVVHVIEGSSGPTEIHVKDLAHDTPFVTAVADGVSESWASFAGGELVIVTNLDAPNKRVVLADPGDPTADRWREVIPEREDVVIETAAALGGRLAVSYLEDVQPRVAIHELDGTHVRDIAFATIGSVGGGAGRWTSDEGVLHLRDVPRPARHLPLRRGHGRADGLGRARPAGGRAGLPGDPALVRVEGRHPRADVRRAPAGGGARRQEPDAADRLRRLQPEPDAALLGPRHHLAAVRRRLRAGEHARRQRVRRGMAPVRDAREQAERLRRLHRRGRAPGRSRLHEPRAPRHPRRQQRGLLVGAVSNQRPELFGAVVCTYPLLDMVRYHQFLVASFWVPEYGSSEDPEQFAYIHAYSPYHNVVEGGDYPATLYLSGDGDTRVAPLHARKMAALMQARNGSDNPILLRYHTQAGHSGGQPVSQQIDEMVDTVSFLLWQVGSGVGLTCCARADWRVGGTDGMTTPLLPSGMDRGTCRWRVGAPTE